MLSIRHSSDAHLVPSIETPTTGSPFRWTADMTQVHAPVAFVVKAWQPYSSPRLADLSIFTTLPAFEVTSGHMDTVPATIVVAN